MKTIKIENGKAFCEGVEIENFAECQPLDGIHFKDEQYPLWWIYKDGNYPLPEGWDVVKYKNLNEFGLFVSARLIRKEQNSAHSYTEGSEIQPTIYTERIQSEKHEKIDLALELSKYICSYFEAVLAGRKTTITLYKIWKKAEEIRDKKHGYTEL